MLKELDSAGKQVGLSINRSKTKVMNNSFFPNIPSIEVNNELIECVEKYTYLGQVITMNSSNEEEITRRVNLGWQAFGSAAWIFRDKSIPLNIKRKLYNQSVLPSATYGCETWSLTKKLALKLRSMQRAHERQMLGISLLDRKSASWIRSKTGLTDVLEKVYRKKWKWAGHLARLRDDRWTVRTTFWTPYGHTRARGRKRTRWRDDLHGFSSTWYQEARDRGVWKAAEEAFVRLRTF